MQPCFKKCLVLYDNLLNVFTQSGHVTDVLVSMPENLKIVTANKKGKVSKNVVFKVKYN